MTTCATIRASRCWPANWQRSGRTMRRWPASRPSTVWSTAPSARPRSPTRSTATRRAWKPSSWSSSWRPTSGRRKRSCSTWTPPTIRSTACRKTAARSVRRPDLVGQPAGQPAPPLVLVHGLRPAERVAPDRAPPHPLRHTRLAGATCGTIRLRLLKIGAQVAAQRPAGQSRHGLGLSLPDGVRPGADHPRPRCPVAPIQRRRTPLGQVSGTPRPGASGRARPHLICGTFNTRQLVSNVCR